jgi:hypothetical protein
MIVGWKRAEDGLYGAGMQAPLALPWAPPASPAEVSSSRHPTDGVRRTLRPDGAAARRSRFPAGDVARRSRRGVAGRSDHRRLRAHGILLRYGPLRQRATERQGEERSAQMDEAFSLGTSAEIAPTTLPTKGVAE